MNVRRIARRDPIGNCNRPRETRKDGEGAEMNVRFDLRIDGSALSIMTERERERERERENLLEEESDLKR
jgi:hypothetical protein